MPIADLSTSVEGSPRSVDPQRGKQIALPENRPTLLFRFGLQSSAPRHCKLRRVGTPGNALLSGLARWRWIPADRIAIVIWPAVAKGSKIELRGGLAALCSKKQELCRVGLHRRILAVVLMACF
jgi:hypothetical protein